MRVLRKEQLVLKSACELNGAEVSWRGWESSAAAAVVVVAEEFGRL